MKNNSILSITFAVFISVTIGKTTIAQDMFKDNFSNNEQWRYVADDVMGGVSKGYVEYQIIEEDIIAVLKGNVSTENNGGFIQIRRDLKDINLENANSVKIVAKGNSQKYYIFLRTTGTILPWQYYASEFTVNENFNEFVLPIKDFEKSGFLLAKKINPKKITSIGIVAFGRDHLAELYVKEIKFTK
jgi:hypothetical protein